MFAILRTKKHSSIAAVVRSARHTFREQITPNALTALGVSNRYSGAKSTRALLSAVERRLPCSRRRDAVICIEYLIAASPEAFARHGGHLDDMGSGYFRDALAWLKLRHGSDNVVCAAVHLDETTPHLAVYVVPLTTDGRLSARDFLGGPKVMRAMQDSFYAECGIKHGLIRGIKGSKAKHTTIASFYTALEAGEDPLVLSTKDYAAKAAGIETGAWKQASSVSLANSQQKMIISIQRQATAARVKALDTAEQEMRNIIERLELRNKELDKREEMLSTQEINLARRQPLLDLVIAEAQASEKQLKHYRGRGSFSEERTLVKKLRYTPISPLSL